MKHLILKEGIKTIGWRSIPKLKEPFAVTIPESVEEIQRNALNGYVNLKVVEIKGSPKTEWGALSVCYGLRKVIFNKNIDKIGSCCFEKDRLLQTVEFKGNVNELEQGAFSTCVSLRPFPEMKNLSLLGPSAFEECISLKEIKLPLSVMFLKSAVFKDCKSLFKVYLPEKIKELGDYLFVNCETLDTVVIDKEDLTDFEVGSKIFEGCPNLKRIVVKEHLVKEFKEKMPEYANFIVSLNAINSLEEFFEGINIPAKKNPDNSIYPKELISLVEGYLAGKQQDKPLIVWCSSPKFFAHYAMPYFDPCCFGKNLSEMFNNIAFNEHSGSPLTNHNYMMEQDSIRKITNEEYNYLGLYPQIKLDTKEDDKTKLYIHAPLLMTIGEIGMNSLEYSSQLKKDLNLPVMLFYKLDFRDKIKNKNGFSDFQELILIDED